MNTKEIIKHNVGIDISMNDFAVAYIVLYNDQTFKIRGTKKFNNNAKGFSEFINWIVKKNKENTEVHFTMEATGVYYESLAYYLHSKEFDVHVVLPNIAKKYIESLSVKSKTDKLDSIALGRLGAERNLEEWTVSSPEFRILKNLTRERNALQIEKTAVSNRLHALNHSGKPLENSIIRCKDRISFVVEQISEIEKEILESINSDSKLKEKVRKLLTIPGVGLITAATILGETNGFAIIKNTRQLTSFAGLDVSLKESGTYKGKTRISKKGNSHIRKILYFPVWTTIKKDGHLKDVYDRLLERKAKAMIAGVAIQRKVLVLIFSMWKSGQEYDSNRGKIMPAAA